MAAVCFPHVCVLLPLEQHNGESCRGCVERVNLRELCAERELGIWRQAERPHPKKNMVFETLPELTITSPCVHSKVESNTFAMGKPYARVDFIPQSGILDLASGRLCYGQITAISELD